MVGFGEVRPVDHPALEVFTIIVTVAGCSTVNWVIVAVRTAKGEVVRNPHGTTRLEAGQSMVLVGRRGALPTTLRKAAKSAGLTYRGNRV